MSAITDWCMTKDCDTPANRGGCPIQTGDNPPCPCPCHHGATEPRGYLPASPHRIQTKPAETPAAAAA
jgi:hypothetical protein